jgi:Uma2 family endonuclease
MVMPALPTHWTVELRNALPDDGKRYEVIDGELFVTPAPSWTHQAALLALVQRVDPYVRAHALGHLLFAPADVELADDSVVEPDLFVVPSVAGRRPKDWVDVGRMLLVVEILSPSTARLDHVRKRVLYQRHYFPEYWVVDVDSRLFSRWRPGDERPEILTDRIEWQPEGAGGAPREPLVIEFEEYFREVVADG